MAEWLLLLRQEICDSNHSYHTQSEGPYLQIIKDKTLKHINIMKRLLKSGWGSVWMYWVCTCTKTPGRKRCRIFSKISFWSTSHVTVRSKYRINGLPNLQELQKTIIWPASVLNNSLGQWLKPLRVLFSTCVLAVQRRLCYTPTGQSSQPARCSYWDSEVGLQVLVFVWISYYYPCHTSGCSDWDLHVGSL